jgi:single-strand DNA-binding protein
MAQFNKVLVMGNLTKDPEIRFVPSGQAVANLRMATNRKYKAGDGQWKEEVTYLAVEVWGKSAEACGEYLKKGSPLFVEGRLKFKEWSDQASGQRRSQLQVVAERVQFLSGGRGQGGAGGSEGGSAEGSFDGPPISDGPPITDDDIPF